MLCHLLYCRGYRTPQAIDEFFTQPSVSYDPFLLPDMERAVQRLVLAREQGERVAVYGDFDCDGITSCAVLVESLRRFGLAPIAHIPTRSDGHGLHLEALASLADQGVDLVVTADCGITAIEEVQVALGMGMDVIVTDHHEARPDGSRPACPTVAPTLHESSYPYRYLCGVGVAYKMAQALAEVDGFASDPEDLLDLVALGTVADVVPLQDENRSLVVRGLKRLQRTQRPGLLALFRAAGVDAARIDPVSVGFYLAPRINAANRMATPQLAYDLITASDPQRATELADQLSELNQERQVLVAEHIERIVGGLGPPDHMAAAVSSGRLPPLLVVIGEWPAGISGLLASKLVDLYGLPAFVGTQLPDGVVSVSGRGIPGIHIDEMLESCEAALPGGLFLGYGGHARAAGFRVPVERLDQTREMLAAGASRQVSPDQIGASLQIDAEVSLDQLTLHAGRMLQSLAPFGVDFAEPLFLARDVVLKRRSPVGDGKHARMSLQRGASWIDGVSFQADEKFLRIPLGSRIDAVFHLQLNEWRGTIKPEIRLRDWRLSG